MLSLLEVGLHQDCLALFFFSGAEYPNSNPHACSPSILSADFLPTDSEFFFMSKTINCNYNHHIVQ